MEELAKHTGNQEIFEAISGNRTMVKQEEPFINLLSGYLQEKDGDTSTKQKVCFFMSTNGSVNCMCMITGGLCILVMTAASYVYCIRIHSFVNQSG